MNRAEQILAFADNVVLIGRQEKIIIIACIRLASAEAQIGLKVNYSKTKFIETSINIINISINDVNIEKVN